MTRRIVLILLMAALLLPLLAIGEEAVLYPIREGGRWGYMDASGQVVIPPQYLSASDFHGGLAAVKGPDGYMLIDSAGQDVLPRSWPLIESVDYQHEELYGIQDSAGLEGYYDLRHRVYCPPKYENLMLEYAGEYLIPGGDGYLTGFVDRRTGGQVIPSRYDPSDSPLFFPDMDAVSGDIPNPDGEGEWLRSDIIRGGGQVIPLPEGVSIYGSFSQGVASFVDEAAIHTWPDGRTWHKQGLMNSQGQVLLAPRYMWMGEASESYIAVCDLDGLWGHIDLQGQEVLSPRYRLMPTECVPEGYRFSQGIAILEMADDSALAIDPAGNTLFTLPADSFDIIGSFLPNGLLWYRKDGLWGLLNRGGDVVAAPAYTRPRDGLDKLPDFQEGRQPVALNDRWGYLDDSGQLVIPCAYDAAESFRHGLARVTLGNRLAYINLHGEAVWQEK